MVSRAMGKPVKLYSVSIWQLVGKTNKSDSTTQWNWNQLDELKYLPLQMMDFLPFLTNRKYPWFFFGSQLESGIKSFITQIKVILYIKRAIP